MHDNIIQKVMRLFNNEIESIKLYNILRTIYWKNCFLKTEIMNIINNIIKIKTENSAVTFWQCVERLKLKF